jgi:DNA modification methylase
LLAFGGSRTFHRIACAIEDAGFEIRDTIMWLYGSGFPKSMNIGLAIDKKNGVKSKIIGERKQAGAKFKLTQELIDNGGFNDPNRESFTIKEAQNKWKGWGSALKPSYEPIIVARKPFKGSLVDNVIQYGVGGINIDECRLAFENGEENSSIQRYNSTQQKGNNGWQHINRGANFNEDTKKSMQLGRFPANTILTYDETDFDEVCGGFPNTKSQKRDSRYNKQTEYTNTYTPVKSDYRDDNTYGDSGSASRYFYNAKASKRDRDEGLEEFEQQKVNDGRKKDADNAFQRGATLRHNIHPTVKPTDLMQYLVRLVTPNNGTILDPFNGSGSTGKAVMYENKDRNKNYKYIGIELTEEYLPISKARIEYVCNLKEEKEDKMQVSFDELLEQEEIWKTKKRIR